MTNDSPVAFITGASGGIGQATVARLRRRGTRVFATDLALASLPCTDPDFFAMSADVRSGEDLRAAVERCGAVFGRIDHVVHLAGKVGRGPIDAVTESDWRELLDVNLTSAFLLAQASHASLAATRGSLVFTASSNGLNGGNLVSGPAYAVAKAGLINLGRYLAKEWAPEGIRVNCVAPGPIDTPMVAGLGAATRERIERNVPLGRLGRSEEVAAAIDYLTSRDAGFVTGTVANVSGGIALD